MAVPAPSKRQLMIIATLNPGDKVRLIDGKEAIFQRAKRTRFVGIIDGVANDIAMSAISDVIDKVSFDDLQQFGRDQRDVIAKLQPSDWFYIRGTADHAWLFRFVRIEGKYIIALNPVIDGSVKIPIEGTEFHRLEE
jgi:hypothetical protein